MMLKKFSYNKNMTRNNTKKRQKRGKNEPKLIGKIMKGSENDPECYLFHILKMRKA